MKKKKHIEESPDKGGETSYLQVKVEKGLKFTGGGSTGGKPVFSGCSHHSVRHGHLK